MNKQKPRHEAFYRLQRKKTSDLEKLASKIETLRDENNKITISNLRNGLWIQADASMVATCIYNRVLSEIRKVETNG